MSQTRVRSIAITRGSVNRIGSVWKVLGTSTICNAHLAGTPSLVAMISRVRSFEPDGEVIDVTVNLPLQCALVITPLSGTCTVHGRQFEDHPAKRCKLFVGARPLTHHFRICITFCSSSFITLDVPWMNGTL